MRHPWRVDRDLAGRFHPQYPDDLQIVVHDGEPRRTGRGPESCWVHTTDVYGALSIPYVAADAQPPFAPATARWRERVVYRGTLLNTPHQLTSVAQGDSVLYLHASGLPQPLMVTEAYLRERGQWSYTPCDRCGADQSLDPPSVMQRTRFPSAPAGAVMLSFSAFCPCGGTMVLGAMQPRPPTRS
ncbi:MAG: hypothetical protein H6713_33635 [Myxococcales bacterium]|nr:hypothetical protein [Myxococcales bacterium]